MNKYICLLLIALASNSELLSMQGISTVSKEHPAIKQNGFDITLGKVVIGAGMLGFAYAGFWHRASYRLESPKDRFLAREIRNLVLKIAIPVTAAGAAIEWAESRIKDEMHEIQKI